MLFLRVSALAGDMGNNLPGHVVLSAWEGSRLHREIAKNYEGLGRTLEETQWNYFASHDVNGSDIIGILSGTPDMYWFEGEILHVVDFKTVSEKELAKGIQAKGRGGTQLLFYAKIILNNNPQKKITKVILEPGVYVRRTTIKASLYKQAEFQEELTPSQIDEKVRYWLNEKLQRKVTLVGSGRGVLGNGGS